MSLSLNNSTIVPLLADDSFIGQNYDNILDFAEIDISIKCDTGYTLTYIYSQDKLNIDYQTSQAITAQLTTQFYKIPVNDRYFKLRIDATDGDMSVLNVQTIYKSSTTFNNSGTGPTSNVAITSPLNGDGSVKVGGSLTLGGSVSVDNFPATQDVNITNTDIPISGSVAVNNFPANQSVSITNPLVAITGSVSVSNLPSTQDVNITNSNVPVSGSVDANITNASVVVSGDVSVNNFPISQTINGSVDAFITNETLVVGVNNFPATQDVNITNSSIPINGSVDANITNASVVVSGTVDSNITNSSLNVAVNNFPATQDVNITNPNVMVNGTVAISNFPTTQDVNITNTSVAVSGSVDANITNSSLNVAVNNFPTTQDVNITNSSVAVSGSVSVDNFPATQDVNITNASVAVSGSVDANITNTSLPITNNNLDNLQFDTLNNLKVVLENASVSVSVDNFPATQDVNITNSYINVGNFPATQNVNLSDITTNTTLNVSDSTTHNYLSTAVSDLNKFNFDSGNNLDINLNNVNSNFIQNGGLKTYVLNSSLAITNSALSNMSFNAGSLNVKDTQNSYSAGALNVSDNTTHTTLSNIYNCVNTRGSGIFIQGSIGVGGYTSVVNLSTLPVKTLTIYGVASDATTLTVLFSQDNVSFYRSQYSYNIPTGGDNFGFALNACPKYICLQSSSALTVLQAYLDYS